MTEQRKDWRWYVAGEGFRDRRFKHMDHALSLAAERYVKGDGQQVRVIEFGGFLNITLWRDMDGADRISGSYSDRQLRYVKTRIAHERALRNVTVAA